MARWSVAPEGTATSQLHGRCPPVDPLPPSLDAIAAHHDRAVQFSIRSHQPHPEGRDWDRRINGLVVHLPPGTTGTAAPLVVDGAARMIPPEEQEVASGNGEHPE